MDKNVIKSNYFTIASTSFYLSTLKGNLHVMAIFISSHYDKNVKHLKIR